MTGAKGARRWSPSQLPSWAPVVLVALVGAGVSWLRLPADARGVVWAEDGARFLQEWVNDSGLHLLTPYDGYLHLVPRTVVGAAASLAPPAAFALVVTGLCCAVVGALAATVYVCAGQVVRTRSARVLLALITVLGPGATSEVLGNAANLHGYFLWAAPWLLLHVPRSWWSSAALAAVVLVGALTEIQMALFVLLLPLTLRHRRGWPVGLALLVGVGAQVWTTLSSPRPERVGERPSPTAVVEGFLANPVLATATGRWPVQGDLVNAVGWWLPAAMLALVGLLGALAVAAGPTRRAAAALACGGAAVVVFAAAVSLNPEPQFLYDTYTQRQWARYSAPRYAVVPTMFLLAVAVLGADALATSSRAARRRVGAAVAVLVLVTLVVNAAPTQTLRSGTRPWSDSIAKAERECARGVDPVSLRIAPAPLSVLTSCQRLGSWGE